MCVSVCVYIYICVCVCVGVLHLHTHARIHEGAEGRVKEIGCACTCLCVLTLAQASRHARTSMGGERCHQPSHWACASKCHVGPNRVESCWIWYCPRGSIGDSSGEISTATQEGENTRSMVAATVMSEALLSSFCRFCSQQRVHVATKIEFTPIRIWLKFAFPCRRCLQS